MLATLVAVPVAYYVADQWLNSFEYRTPLSLWVLVAPWVDCDDHIVHSRLRIN